MVSASAFQVDDLSSILSTYNLSPPGRHFWTIAISRYRPEGEGNK
jgi:hypothetical protein